MNMGGFGNYYGRYTSIILFWGGYVRSMAFLSVLLHIVLLKIELRKDNPEIPYIQDLP